MSIDEVHRAIFNYQIKNAKESTMSEDKKKLELDEDAVIIAALIEGTTVHMESTDNVVTINIPKIGSIESRLEGKYKFDIKINPELLKTLAGIGK